MKTVTSIILMLLILQTLPSATFSQTPQKLKGTWAVDAKATAEFLKNAPPPRQELQWISLSSGLMFQMTYEFTDNTIAVSAYTSEKKLIYQLLPEHSNQLRYEPQIKKGDRDDIWTVTVISADNISISSSQNPGTKYFLLKRVKLDQNTRAEDAKRAFEVWQAWAQEIAPVISPDAKVGQAKSALWEAITKRDVEKAKTLISSGANVNYTDQLGNSVLHQSLFLGNTEFIEFLIAKGANVDIQNNQGETPLHWVAGGGIGAKGEEAMLEMARVLLAHGADVNKMSSAYGTPLSKAAYYNKLQMAKLLIAHGADVEGKGASPLSATGNSGSVEMAQLLVEHGAGVNTRARNGSYPLHNAVFHGKLTTFLLSRGANPNALTEQGFAALYLAAQSDYGAASAEVLLNHGADPNAKNTHGRKALHQAALQGATKVIAILLAHKADINTSDKEGYTPLYDAILRGQIDAVESLLNNGADVNKTNDRDGESPLHKAISRGHIAIVKLLISHGADVNAVSKFGVTSFVFARNSKDITRLLQEHGAH